MKLKRIIVCLIFSLFNVSLFAQNYGIVLSGGGGKGAYEVGVWKALEEYGIAQKATVFSGTSVGGLNSAMFTCSQTDECIRLWREVVPVELTRDDEFISQTGLKKMLEMVDLSRLQKNIYPKVYVTAVRDSYTTLKIISSIFIDWADRTKRFLLNTEKDVGEIKNKLLATSAVPYLTNPVRLSDGYDYIDGGFENYGGDNIPLVPLLKNHPELDRIIIVYLDFESKVSVPEDLKADVIEIRPTIDLNGMLGSIDFSRPTINRIMDQGYEDAVEVLSSKKMYPVSSYWFED